MSALLPPLNLGVMLSSHKSDCCLHAALRTPSQAPERNQSKPTQEYDEDGFVVDDDSASQV